MTNNEILFAHLNEINTFVVIVELGSFSAAAEKLGISRAHVSRQLKQLESALNTQLVIRTTRTQRLTQDGERFFLTCQTSLLQISHSINSLNRANEKMSGHISINCVGGIIGEQIVAQLVNRFIKQHPNISIELDFSSDLIDMHKSKFDLVLRMGELDDSLLIARKIANVNIGLYASPEYINKNGLPKNPKELKQHNCLTGSVKKWKFVHKNMNSEFETVEVEGQFICKNGYSLLHAAIAGNGICRLPELYCEPYVAKGSLISIFEDWKINSTPLHLLYHSNKYQSTRLKELIKYLLSELPSRFI